MSKKPGFGFAGFSLGQAKKPMVKAFSEEDDGLDGEDMKEPEPAVAKQVCFSALNL